MDSIAARLDWPAESTSTIHDCREFYREQSTQVSPVTQYRVNTPIPQVRWYGGQLARWPVGRMTRPIWRRKRSRMGEPNGRPMTTSTAQLPCGAMTISTTQLPRCGAMTAVVSPRARGALGDTKGG